MLGFLKRTLDHLKPRREETVGEWMEIPVPKAVPTARAPIESPRRNGSPTSAGGVALRGPQMQAAPDVSESPDHPPLTLALKPIVARLPEDLQAHFNAAAVDSAEVALRIPDVVEQLQRGAVKVTFGTLRKAAPARTCTLTSASHDRNYVEIPIEIVLPHVKLKRRPNQRKITIPDDEVPQLNLRGNEVVESAPTPTPAPAPASNGGGLRLKMDGPAPSETTKASPAAPKPKATGPVVRLAIADLSGVWPRDVIDFVVLNDLEGAVVDIPFRELEPMMREGKVAFLWEALAEWITPQPPASTFGNPVLPLPLAQVTPEFMRVSAEHSESEAHAAVSPALTTPAPVPAENDSAVCLDIDLGDLDVEQIPEPQPIRGAKPVEISSPGGSPQELVETACELDAVDGALVSSHDGLSIAAQFPDLLDPKIVAAFLPEIVVRTRVYFSEIDLVEPDSMVISTGDRKLVILPVGRLFMAFLTAPDTEPPLRRLREITDRLEQLALEI